jgi:hypothetical protein
MKNLCVFLSGLTFSHGGSIFWAPRIRKWNCTLSIRFVSMGRRALWITVPVKYETEHSCGEHIGGHRGGHGR